MHDIVRFARVAAASCARAAARRPIPRSATASASPPSIPAAIDLLFERFISAERDEPPDIDVDFEHERREEVIQYIYAKYGRDRAGIAATVIRYRAARRIREVGKAMGLSDDTVSRLAGAIWGWGRAGIAEERAREPASTPPTRRCAMALRSRRASCSASRAICRSMSAASCITRGPLIETRADRQRRHGRPHHHRMGQGRHRRARHPQGRCAGARHADLHPQGLRAAGAAITAAASTLATVPRGGPGGLRHAVPGRHPRRVPGREPGADEHAAAAAARELLRSGDRGGDRPARADPGRHGASLSAPAADGKEPVDLPVARSCEQVLGKTLGVPLFQEQAMQIAIVAAGFTPEEADQLRRAMATFRKVGTIHTFERR